ncbi:hypothetical protein [Rossellomorea sp. NS-SX7]|uniref:hypothetical protein n=1 Tax=Rossellomorea sp. NS-SX7 TaxID=3463856 RepID=UPI0040594825
MKISMINYIIEEIYNRRQGTYRMRSRKEWLYGVVCLTVICSLVSYGFTAEKGYAESRQELSLKWLQKQLDAPVYPVYISLSEEYPVEPIDLLSGRIDVPALQDYSLRDVPYITTDAYGIGGFSGELKGTWGNVDDPSRYSIVIYDKTDAKYLVGSALLEEDGSWSSGNMIIHGIPVFELVDENGRVAAVGAQDPVKTVIEEYEVKIYAVSDIPYLQTTLPIREDGYFSTEDAGDTYYGLKTGKKEARLVRKSDGKIFSTTEIPKWPLIRSYHVPIEDPANRTGVDGRSWIYDNALAVSAFSMAGDRARASSILSAMAGLQNKDGSFAFSYHIYTGPLDKRKRSGSIAWAGDAAITYEKHFGDPTYRNMAIRAAEFLLKQQNTVTGSIKGGPDVSWYSTEHNIDAYFFFRNLGKLTGNERYTNAASDIEKALLTVHWNQAEKRFNQGINDPAEALDTNSWGAMFLEAIGRTDLSSHAIAYLDHFKVNDARMELSDNPFSYNQSYSSHVLLSGYKPYGNGYDGAPEVVWSEGTWGVINLFLRTGMNADSLMESMFALQDADPDGGLVYGHEGHAQAPFEFHVWPSVAGTAWQYMTLKDPEGIWGAD